MVDQGNTFQLDPYTLLDAALSWWASDGTRLTLSVHNLLDEEYYWNGDTSRAESADPEERRVKRSWPPRSRSVSKHRMRRPAIRAHR